MFFHFSNTIGMIFYTGTSICEQIQALREKICTTTKPMKILEIGVIKSNFRNEYY